MGKSINDKEVYCEECEYLINPHTTLSMLGSEQSLDICIHKDNKGYSDSWRTKNPQHIIYKKRPHTINKNNNCLWFKKRKTAALR